MSNFPQWLRSATPRLFAIVAVGLLYYAAVPANVPDTTRRALAASFAFQPAPLPEPSGSPANMRPVAPSFQHINGWISSVGAAVALYDIDGNGLADDVCYVETRTNQVIVAPAPGTGDRYPPFVLDPTPLSYDPDTMAPMGCLPGHMTEGSQADILVYYWGRPPVAFLRVPTPALDAQAFVAQELVAGQPRWYTNAALFADLRGTGHADLVVANYFADGARILEQGTTEGQSMQNGMSRAQNGGGKHFLVWSSATRGAHPSVVMKEVEPQLDAEARHGWTLALAAADLTGDQRPELYFANDFGPDRLLLNQSTAGSLRFVVMRGTKRFTTPNSKVLGRDSFKGMGIDFADVDGNGKTALFVSNITGEYALEESNFLWMPTGGAWDVNSRVAPYSDRSESRGVARSGWAWDAKMADFDNSGRVEIVQATGFVYGSVNRWPELQELAMANDEFLRHPWAWPRFTRGDALSEHDHDMFYVPGPDGVFVDVAAELGLEPRERRYVSRAIAVADVDGSGRLSFAMANQWAGSTLYRNVATNSNSFLGLHLRYPVDPAASFAVSAGNPGAAVPSRPAISATAFVTLPDGRVLQAQVDGGNGHGGKRSPDLHFGLGPMPLTTPLQVELQWRDGSVEPRKAKVVLRPGWHTIVLGSNTPQAGQVEE